MLALMAIARLQDRDMVAFLFSGSAHELTRFDFPKGRAPHQTVITAVETFYNGGTVFEPWMEAALKAVDEAQYNRADVIAATDGLTSISAAARDAWQQRRSERVWHHRQRHRQHRMVAGMRERRCWFGCLRMVCDYLS